MTQNILYIDNLAIGYKSGKDSRILHKDLCFGIQQGEMNCLLGPNGAGKSTLLRTISGFQPAFNGDIKLKGKSTHDISAAELSQSIAVVLTDRIDAGNLRVYDIASMGRHPYTSFWGSLTSKDLRMVGQALEMTGMISMKNRMFSSLSDGEKQKVMIAKALAQDTPIMILDEPTAFLDFPSKIEIMRLLKKLSTDTSKSILMSTHDVELAIQSADRIFLLAQEKPFVAGIPEDLVINDHIHNFFEKPGVEFSKETGAFRISGPQHTEIGLLGDGLAAQWLGRALNRKGYIVVEGKNQGTFIQINAINEYILKMNDQEFHCNCMEDVFHHLLDA
ncbi:MAG: ABC transporter ATP-binding protein [Bacteroidales bacterium]|nr:ABC transporter ATP-binding protein [Bacteroidales bacterium]